MSISETNQRKADRALAVLRKSAVAPEEQALLEGYVADALATTNGLTPEEKLQACTENQLALICLFAIHVANPRPDSWKDVFISCKRELMWAAFGVCALLAFRPQLGALLDHLIPGRG